MRKKTVFIAVAFIILMSTAVFIFSNSMLSGEESNQKSAVIVNIIRPIIDPDGTMEYYKLQDIVRKTAHFGEFFLLGAGLTAIAVLIEKKIFTPWLFMPLFFILLMAVTDEFIQSFTGRTSLVKDVIIDSCGGICGLLFIVCIFAIARAVIKSNNKTKRIDTLSQ